MTGSEIHRLEVNMSSTDATGATSTQTPDVGTVDMKGPDPEHRCYQTYASLNDPDGNEGSLQEIRTRLPGREWED
jgi:hypothetical protein